MHGNLSRRKILTLPQHNLSSLRVDANHEPRFSKCDSQPCALTDGKMFVTFVVTKYPACEIDKIAGRTVVASIAFQKSCIVLIGDKANLIAVLLVRDAQPCIARQFTDVRLLKRPDRQ